MSDLEEDGLEDWYMWYEAVTDTSKPAEEIASMVCVMTGYDIVRYRREKYGDAYNHSSDEEVLNDHCQVHWAFKCKDPSALSPYV